MYNNYLEELKGILKEIEKDTRNELREYLEEHEGESRLNNDYNIYNVFQNFLVQWLDDVEEIRQLSNYKTLYTEYMDYQDTVRLVIEYNNLFGGKMETFMEFMDYDNYNQIENLVSNIWGMDFEFCFKVDNEDKLIL